MRKINLDKLYIAEIYVCIKKEYHSGLEYTSYFKSLKFACVYKDLYSDKYIDFLTNEKYGSRATSVGEMKVNFNKMTPLLSYLDDIPKNHKMFEGKTKKKVLSMKLNEKTKE